MGGISLTAGGARQARLGFLRHPNLNRVSPADMNYVNYRDEKRQSNRIKSGLGRQVNMRRRGRPLFQAISTTAPTPDILETRDLTA